MSDKWVIIRQEDLQSLRAKLPSERDSNPNLRSEHLIHPENKQELVKRPSPPGIPVKQWLTWK